MKMTELKRFDPVDYLDSYEDIELFLEEAMTSGSTEHIKQALIVAERARLKLDNQPSLNDIIAQAVFNVLNTRQTATI